MNTLSMEPHDRAFFSLRPLLCRSAAVFMLQDKARMWQTPQLLKCCELLQGIALVESYKPQHGQPLKL